MNVKSDHRGKFSNLSNWKEEAWKKITPDGVDRHLPNEVCKFINCVTIHYGKGARRKAFLGKEKFQAQITNEVKMLRVLKEAVGYAGVLCSSFDFSSPWIWEWTTYFSFTKKWPKGNKTVNRSQKQTVFQVSVLIINLVMGRDPNFQRKKDGIAGLTEKIKVLCEQTREVSKRIEIFFGSYV